ncbi:glycoside hydrolase family 79 amino-terminal domain protein [Medicago truncatula]|uniref:Glycoside hydrolase family 79 amino-terminal domain protein n=1 Tax=Medicago truncatula TaxID=3880 RepID=G7LBA6_MEDTR|nr:glycoside hydrolase family 79 amino-terminal domain protein [Medicago truncatula]
MVNAESLIRYTVSKNYTIHGWELDNELCGNGVGISVGPYQYPKPLVIAPGGFFDENWFKEFLRYNDRITEKILDPAYLDGVAGTFSSLKNVYFKVQESQLKHGLVRLEVLTIVAIILYLMHFSTASGIWINLACQLLTAPKHTAERRQTLIGRNYVLFFGTDSWRTGPVNYLLSMEQRRSELMHTVQRKLRASHTLLLLNLDNSTTVDVQVTLNYVGESQRREYHLTAKDGNLRCQTMLLNGNILSVNSAGDIPLLNPINNQLILQLTLQKYDKAKK